MTQSERNEIYLLKEKGYSLRSISKALDRSVSTISDEIKHNSVNGIYDPKKANTKADVRRKAAKFQSMKILSNYEVRDFVEKKLLDPEIRSPSSIAGRIKHQEHHLLNISRRSIERYLSSPHGRKIEYARYKMKGKRKHRKKNTKPKGVLDGRVLIDERPQYIDDRERVGDVEADFIVSGRDGKGIYLVVTDRKLRYSYMEKILPVSIANMERAFRKIHEQFPELSSVTTDNDLLFIHHKRLQKILGVPIYFCHPYSSWEKGTVENANGVIRKDMPKSSDLSKYSDEFVDEVRRKINNRYLECLKFKTPAEALEEYRERRRNGDPGCSA